MLLKGNYRRIEPASAAVIMAIGIFLIGAIEAFPFLQFELGRYLTLLFLLLWILIYKKLTIQFFHQHFLVSFIKHPIHSFTMGTWIAGVSVLCNVMLVYFPKIIWLIQIIAACNSLLWLFFLANCLYNFKQLMGQESNYPVHGILLLSTVGTQSIIILLNNVFFQLPIVFSQAIILLGLLFYLVSMYLIVKRYVTERGWTIADDWKNTNCIIHGALSITGLAIVTSNTFNLGIVLLLWFVVFSLLILVELIEVMRAIVRVRSYGIKQGILSYDVSQWSRNFTFGMFYAFTAAIHAKETYVIPRGVLQFQEEFLPIWAWIVLLTLIAQFGIYLHHRMGYILYDKVNHEI